MMTQIESSPSDTTEVVERYQQMVYALCLTHTPSRGDAEDVFQEVFLTYHRKQPACHDEEHRKAWLIRTTLTVACRVATSSWRSRVVLGPVDEPADTFRFDVEEYDELFRALTALPEEYRSSLHLFYFEDLPVSQIAALLGQTPGAVKTRLSRGRTLLRQTMKEEAHVHPR